MLKNTRWIVATFLTLSLLSLQSSAETKSWPELDTAEKKAAIYTHQIIKKRELYIAYIDKLGKKMYSVQQKVRNTEKNTPEYTQERERLDQYEKFRNRLWQQMGSVTRKMDAHRLMTLKFKVSAKEYRFWHKIFIRGHKRCSGFFVFCADAERKRYRHAQQQLTHYRELCYKALNAFKKFYKKNPISDIPSLYWPG